MMIASGAPKVLLVEENPLLPDITAFRLELLGFQVEKAVTGAEAVAVVQNQLPDVIIIELILPDTDGIDLTNRLKNDRRTSSIPIMILSHVAELDDVQLVHGAGADDYLVVPYDPIVLEQKLERLLAAVGKTL